MTYRRSMDAIHDKIVARERAKANAQRIRTRCAWCQKLIHDGYLFQGKHESHGICPSCDKELRAECGL